MADVLVIGGGNAALCAALMAREAGASVLLLESAPREWRGGNSQHTRNLRCMHDEPQDVLVDAYPEEEFWQDLLKVKPIGMADASATAPAQSPRNTRAAARPAVAADVSVAMVAGVPPVTPSAAVNAASARVKNTRFGSIGPPSITASHQ